MSLYFVSSPLLENCEGIDSLFPGENANKCRDPEHPLQLHVEAKGRLKWHVQDERAFSSLAELLITYRGKGGKLVASCASERKPK